MKTKKNAFLLAILTFSLLQASAQDKRAPLNEPNYSKVKIFADVPDKMSLRTTGIESLLDLSVGASVNTTIANGFSVTGTVVSKSPASSVNVKTVVIKCINRPGAAFTFTRITDADGSFRYSGRLFSKAGGDALEIVKEGKSYSLRKKGIYEIVNE